MVFSIDMKKYMIQYRANPVDYEATFEKARENGVTVKRGGGRPTKGGEPTNAQIIFHLRDIDSKITISCTGRVEVYYPSRPNLEKCIEILKQCYVPREGELELHCEGPIDPLNLAFEYTITENWKGTELRCVEAKVDMHQWLDLGTGEYIFQLPDKMGRVIWLGANCIYQGRCPVRIIAIDKDDKQGNRIATAEKLVWKGIQELKRVVKEHPRVKFQNGRAVDVP